MPQKERKFVTLRGKKRDSRAKPMVAFRCPPELRRYIDETAPATGRDKTEIITDALKLDRDLALRLRTDQSRLEAFALEQKLDIDEDLPEVLARLVRIGLESLFPKGRR